MPILYQTPLYFEIIFRLLIMCFLFQVVSISEGHTCASTSKVRGKEATKGWIADRAKDILKSKPGLGAKKLQEHLEHQFPVKMSYSKV
jgi:hypothetical protein